MPQGLCRLAFLVALIASGCGGASSSAPSPPPPVLTLSGHVSATNGGQPLSGVRLTINGLTASTDAGGAFSVTLASPSTYPLTLDGAGIVPRSLRVAVAASRDLPVDAISLAGGFDLGFYRQLVRNAHDAPGTMQPLRRVGRAPMIYLRTIDDLDAAIDAKTLDATERAIVEAMPMWSGYAASVVRGTELRLGQSGWVTVVWRADAGQGACGLSDVAVDGGEIGLYYRRGGDCRCAGGPEITPRTVKHELGHAMGFWHTDNEADVMAPGVPGCDAQPSARELYHAAIAYRRPVGNMDPDIDPVGTVHLAPMTAR